MKTISFTDERGRTLVIPVFAIASWAEGENETFIYSRSNKEYIAKESFDEICDRIANPQGS